MFLTPERIQEWKKRYLLENAEDVNLESIPEEVRNQVQEWVASSRLVRSFENNCNCRVMELIFPGEGSRLFQHFVTSGYNALHFSNVYLTSKQKNIFLTFIFTEGEV